MTTPGNEESLDEPATAAQTLTSVDAIAAEFRRRWRGPDRAAIGDYVRNLHGQYRLAVLGALIRMEMGMRAQAGESIHVESYLADWPELRDEADLLDALLVAEYTLRERTGSAPKLEEYARRFPTQFKRLQLCLDRGTRVFDKSSESDAVKHRPGQIVGDYEIVRELGVGGTATVYLARQRSLDRQIALKVSTMLGDEGRTLALLEHDHIVPVFAQEVIGRRRYLAMRYLPGITFGALLKQLAHQDRRTLSGENLFERLDGNATESGVQVDKSPRERLHHRSFVAICARLACDLATALQYAHDRGVLHLDVKPDNILLCQNGRAMLMDFNVSVRLEAQIAAAETVIGGTVPYMAPEQLAQFVPNVEALNAVDARADVYALGVVLYELLTGRNPFPVRPISTPRAAALGLMLAERMRGSPLPTYDAGDVPADLRAIIVKCLQPKPSERYRTAAELAEDLERHLADEPLKYAGEQDWRHRSKKWFRRHRRACKLAAAILLCGLCAYGGMLAVEFYSLATARNLIVAAEAAFQRGNAILAGDQLAEADQMLAHSNPLVGAFTSRSRIDAQRRLNSSAASVAAKQHSRFEKTAGAMRAGARLSFDARSSEENVDPLAYYRVMEDPEWRRRPVFRNLPTRQRRIVEEDVTELLFARALHVLSMYDASPLDAQRHRNAEKLLNLIPPGFGQLRILRDVRAITRTTTPLDELQVTPDGTPGEFNAYLSGILACKRERFAVAIGRFDDAVRLRDRLGLPPRYWTFFMRAFCAERVDRLERAIADYGVCIGLRPDFAWAHHNLGLIYAKREDNELAASHFQRAVTLEPRLASAHNSLGVALVRIHQFADAVSSFDAAIGLNPTDADVLANRGAALAALHDFDGAERDLEAALQLDPDCAAARTNLERLRRARE